MVDAGGTVIVNGPTSIRKTSKAFVIEVRNTGTAPLTVLSTNIDADVSVNGSPSGVVIVDPATKTLSPGAKYRFKATWNYTGLTAGATVEYNACVTVDRRHQRQQRLRHRYRHGQVGRRRNATRDGRAEGIGPLPVPRISRTTDQRLQRAPR